MAPRTPQPRPPHPVVLSSDPHLLIDAVATGDVDAFGRLHEIVSPMVVRVTNRVVRDRAIAAEVTQEVMLEIWVKAPERDATSPTPLAWISTIAHRRAIDRVRSEQAESDRRQRDARRSSHLGRGDPTADIATEHLEWQQIACALEGLSQRQREVIEMAFYRGLTYAEVARVLDIPIGTVKTRIRDALIRLRRHLAEPTPTTRPVRSAPR